MQTDRTRRRHSRGILRSPALFFRKTTRESAPRGTVFAHSPEELPREEIRARSSSTKTDQLSEETRQPSSGTKTASSYLSEPILQKPTQSSPSTPPQPTPYH